MEQETVVDPNVVSSPEENLLPSEEEMKAAISSELSSMVKTSSELFLKERRDEISRMIIKQFQKLNGLIAEVRKLTSELNKKQQSLELVQLTIQKIRNGDWNTVTQLEKEMKKANQKQDSEQQ